MWSSYDFYSWTPAISAEPWLVALIAVLLNAVVIWLATMLVPSAQKHYGWCILAALLTELAAYAGQLLVPGPVGVFVALALVALAYHMTLGTSFLGSFGMVVAVAVVRLALMLLLASYGEGTR